MRSDLNGANFFECNMMTILGDPGADGGARESRSGRKQKVGEEKSRAKAFTFALYFPSPHYLAPLSAPLSAPGSPRMHDDQLPTTLVVPFK